MSMRSNHIETLMGWVEGALWNNMTSWVGPDLRITMVWSNRFSKFVYHFSPTEKVMIHLSLHSAYVVVVRIPIMTLTWAWNAMDYSYANGRFSMSKRNVTVSDRNYLSSSETKVNAGIRRWKLHLSESAWCQESNGCIIFTKSSFSTTQFRIWQFQTDAETQYSILKCIS
jgi:hypothetical protein